MIFPILTPSFPPMPLSKKDILRYAGVKENTPEMNSLLDECLAEAKGVFTNQACFCRLPYEEKKGICDFNLFSVFSRDLAKSLSGCRTVILFAATVGVGIDRLIARYSHVSPAKALLFQAIGTQRVEALCDSFFQRLEQDEGIHLRPRFSPGYGDLPLGVQKEIFSLMDLNKIGLGLTDSLLMTPTKSVTAFAGICPEEAR